MSRPIQASHGVHTLNYFEGVANLQDGGCRFTGVGLWVTSHNLRAAGLWDMGGNRLWNVGSGYLKVGLNVTLQSNNEF